MSRPSRNNNIKEEEQGTNPKVEGTNQDKGATTTPANDTGNTANQGVQPQELKPIELSEEQVKKMFKWMSDEANEKEDQDSFIKSTLTDEQKVDFDAGAEIDYSSLESNTANTFKAENKEIEEKFEKNKDTEFKLSTAQLQWLSNNFDKSIDDMEDPLNEIQDPVSKTQTTVQGLLEKGYSPDLTSLRAPTLEDASSLPEDSELREQIETFHEMKDKDLASVSGQLGVAKNMLVSSVTDIFNFSPAQFTGAGLVAGVAGFFGRKYLGVWGVLKATFMATSTIGTLLWNKLTGVKHAVSNAKTFFKNRAQRERDRAKDKLKFKAQRKKDRVKAQIEKRRAVKAEKIAGKARELKAKKLAEIKGRLKAQGKKVITYGQAAGATALTGAALKTAKVSTITTILAKAGTDPDKINKLKAQIKAVGTKNGITSKFPEDYRKALAKDGRPGLAGTALPRAVRGRRPQLPGHGQARGQEHSRALGGIPD